MMTNLPILLAAPALSLPQFIISIPLFFVLFFGIGFILNMILKTTWLPVILYLALVVILLIRLNTYHWVDLAVLVTGLIGAGISGWTIQTLRVKGYRMF